MRAVDPGGSCLGWSYWMDGFLYNAGLSRPPKYVKAPWERAVWHRTNLAGMAHEGTRLVSERMVIRGFGSKEDPQDLCDVNLIAGHLANEWFSPQEWKGSLPRDLEEGRVRERLSPSELEVLVALPKIKLRHNAISAIGIGLFALGRGWKK